MSEAVALALVAVAMSLVNIIATSVNSLFIWLNRRETRLAAQAAQVTAVAGAESRGVREVLAREAVAKATEAAEASRRNLVAIREVHDNTNSSFEALRKENASLRTLLAKREGRDEVEDRADPPGSRP